MEVARNQTPDCHLSHAYNTLHTPMPWTSVVTNPSTLKAGSNLSLGEVRFLLHPAEVLCAMFAINFLLILT